MADAIDYAVGDYICMAREPRIFGVAMYLGFPAFASGLWVGIELTEPIGRNDGCARGKRYFKCEPGRGLFIKASLCQKMTYGAFVEATEAKIHKIIEDQSKRQQQQSPIRLGSPSSSPSSQNFQISSSNNASDNKGRINNFHLDFSQNSAIYFSPSSSPEYKNRPGSYFQSPMSNTDSAGFRSNSSSPDKSNIFFSKPHSHSIGPLTSSRPSSIEKKNKETGASTKGDVLNSEIVHLRDRTEHLERCIGRAGDLLSEMAEFTVSFILIFTTFSCSL